MCMFAPEICAAAVFRSFACFSAAATHPRRRGCNSAKNAPLDAVLAAHTAENESFQVIHAVYGRNPIVKMTRSNERETTGYFRERS